MKNALAGLLLLLAACSPSRQIAVAATDAASRAEEIHRLAERIGSVSTQPEVVADAATIAVEAKAIEAAAGSIHRALPGVEDQTPWWAALLQWGFVAVSVVAVVVLLWQTGIGQALRAAIGLIPRRKVAEARSECERLLRAAERALAVDRAILEGDEPRVIADALAELAAAARGNDAERMRVAMEHVDTVTKPFAVRRMNKAIAEALAGRTVDEVDATPDLVQGAAP